MEKKNPDESVSSLQSIEDENQNTKKQQNQQIAQIPQPYPQQGQIPVTFAPADKQVEHISQPVYQQPQNIPQFLPENQTTAPQFAAPVVLPVQKNQQMIQQQPSPGMSIQPQLPFYPQQANLQQQPFPEIQPNPMMMNNPNQIYHQPQPFQQPVQIPAQSFAVPGQNPQNAVAPQPFNPTPPAYLPQMAPLANHYPWQNGSHYVVGQPANYQCLYYPGAAPAKALIGEEALHVPEGLQFQQEKIDLSQGKKGEGRKVANAGCHCQGPWGLLLASGIIVLVGLILGIFIHPALFAIFGVFYLIRSIIICCSDTAKFLQQLNLDINPYEHTEQLQQTEPYTQWRIQCYHMETRTRTVTQRDANGNTHTRVEHYQVRVDTHSASKHITYPNCGDASPILSGLEDFRMTRIYYKFDIAFDSQEVQTKFNQDRRDWIRYHDRDTHYDFSTNDVLPGLISHFLSFNDEKQKFPKCLNCGCLTVLSVFLLDWILIFWFMRHSARLDYRFLKVASNYDLHQ